MIPLSLFANGLVSRSRLLIERYGCMQLSAVKLLATDQKTRASDGTKSLKTVTKLTWSKNTRAKVKEINMRKPTRFSAYTLFCIDNIPAIKETTKDKSGVNLIKECAALWRTLPPEEVKKFKDEAASRSTQYVSNMEKFKESLTEEEMKLLELEIQHKKDKKRKMLEKESGKPKRTGNAFTIFVRKTVEENKQITLKEVGEKWKTLPAKEKEKFEELHKKEKIKYEAEMSKWVKANVLKENYKVLKKVYVVNELYNVLKKPSELQPGVLKFRDENVQKYKSSKDIFEAYQKLPAVEKRKLNTEYKNLSPNEKRALTVKQKPFLKEHEENCKLWRENMTKIGLTTFVQLAEKLLKKKSFN